MDPNIAPELVPAVVGGTAGFIGGAVAALSRNSTIQQVMAAVLGGTAIGACVAAALVSWFNLAPAMAGVIGLCGGLCVFGIVKGMATLSDKFGSQPERLLPDVVRRYIGRDDPEDTPEDTPCHKPPAKRHRPKKPKPDGHDRDHPPAPPTDEAAP